jgi:hypothetical protein
MRAWVIFIPPDPTIIGSFPLRSLLDRAMTHPVFVSFRQV